jgi:hypothetical protein
MKRTLATIGLIAAVLPLAACEKTDTELAMDFVNSWLEARGAIAKNKDGGYSPTLKGAGVAMGFATTGDDQADAAVQAGKMAKDIAETDKLIKEAEAANAKIPPDTKTADEKFKAAIDARPDDWYYRNHRAFMNVDRGNTTSAQADFKAGMEGCNGNTHCLAAMHRDRVNFYGAYQTSAFMSADPRMRSNCAVYDVGIESFLALAQVSTGTTKEQYQQSAATAQAMKRDQGC